MKKVLSVVSVVAIVLLFVFCNHFYTKEMIINDVAEYATAIDNDGEIWAFGPDDLNVGDTVSPILFDNFTSSIYDDVVVNTNVDTTALVFVLTFLSFCFPVLGLVKEAKAETLQKTIIVKEGIMSVFISKLSSTNNKVYVDSDRCVDIAMFSKRLGELYQEVLSFDCWKEYPAMDALFHDLVLMVVKNVGFEFNLTTIETITIIEEFIDVHPWANINDDVRKAEWFSVNNTEFNNDTEFDFGTL